MKPTNTTGILNAFDDIISVEEMAQRSHNTSYKEESRNNHASYECKTVATLNDRREYVKNKQLCYNCMNSGHTSRECRSPKCRKCDKKHNSALCPKNQNTTHSSQHNAYNERKQNTENQNWKTYKNDNLNNFRKPNEGQQQRQQKYQPNQKQWNQGQGNQQNGQKSSEIQAILLRIRQGKYVISGDIEKAFHAVEVKESDRDALRFLWLIDPNKPPSNDNIRYMRFTRLPFGRHIDFKKDEDVEIAVFTDASEIAYGACLFLKTKKQEKEGQFNTHLLIAKRRIAPKSNPLTISKLELLGILIGIRLLKYVLREMKLNAKNIDIFSDSTIALAQIKNQSSTKAEKQPIFVENRTREIWNTLLDLKKEDESRNINLAHVFTDQNPADHITRGCNSIEELVMTNWPNGNEWLSDNNHKDHPYQISDDNKIIVPVPLDDIPVNEKSSTATALVVKNKKTNNSRKRNFTSSKD
ncbi:unnamed protein product [Caenorhabditis nigoni]